MEHVLFLGNGINRDLPPKNSTMTRIRFASKNVKSSKQEEESISRGKVRGHPLRSCAIRKCGRNLPQIRHIATYILLLDTEGSKKPSLEV